MALLRHAGCSFDLLHRRVILLPLLLLLLLLHDLVPMRTPSRHRPDGGVRLAGSSCSCSARVRELNSAQSIVKIGSPEASRSMTWVSEVGAAHSLGRMALFSKLVLGVFGSRCRY